MPNKVEAFFKAVPGFPTEEALYALEKAISQMMEDMAQAGRTPTEILGALGKMRTEREVILNALGRTRPVEKA